MNTCKFSSIKEQAMLNIILENPVLTQTDVVIYAVEINDRHGVGILVQRIFPDSKNIVSIRAIDIYNGEHTFGGVAIQISHSDLDRAAGLENVKQALAGYQIDRVLCIPYHNHEVLTALAIHELFGSSICTYIMDDRNVLIHDIPDDIMAELLSKSNLCLGISPEMCDVYFAKYGVEMHFVPPVLPPELINPEIPQLSLSNLQSQTGAMIGNVWSPTWLKLLRQTTKAAEIKLDWYGNTGAEWNIHDRSQLQADGITEKGFLATEIQVAQTLRQYPYVIIASGTLDEYDDNSPNSWLSLPSRIPFIIASSNTPILLIGNQNTAAARFIQRLGIGIVTDYQMDSLRQSINYITQPHVQREFRTRGAKLAPLFENRLTDEWIWQSLSLGKPVDLRFERLRPHQSDYSSALVQSFTAIRGYHQLTTKLSQYQQQNQTLTTELSQYQQQNQVITTELLQYQQQNQALTAELSQCQQQTQILTTKLLQQQQQTQILKQKYDLFHQESQQDLHQKLVQAHNIVESMESSKFWKLRTKWFKVKGLWPSKLN
jgi:hypothetical protein